jgi:hypothetical protein
LKATINTDLADSERGLSGHLPAIVRREVQPGVRNLVQLNYSAKLDHLRDLVGDEWKKEVVLWILIAVLGVLTATSFYRWWLKVGS